jgi:hypothetical protein
MPGGSAIDNVQLKVLSAAAREEFRDPRRLPDGAAPSFLLDIKSL